MGMPRSHKQELLHRAYVSAVVAIAGLKLTWGEPEYGVDCSMQDVKTFVTPRGIKRNEVSGPILQFQLKSTVRWELRRNQIIYDMEADAYNKLVDSEGRLLILYCLPDNINDRICVKEEELILKKCCYWFHVTGSLCGKTQKRIYIPSDQLFIPSCLRELLLQLKLGRFSHGNNS